MCRTTKMYPEGTNVREKLERLKAKGFVAKLNGCEIVIEGKNPQNLIEAFHELDGMNGIGAEATRVVPSKDICRCIGGV